MAKKQKIKTDDKPLSQEEVSKFKPADKTTEVAQVMGFGLQSAFDIAVTEGAVVVKRTNPEIKAGNVDKLPK